MKEKSLNEIRGIILLAIGIIVLASLISYHYDDLPFNTSHPNIPPKNFIRTFGAYLSGILVFLSGRMPSYLVPLFILWLGVSIFRQNVPYLNIPRIAGFFILLLSTSSLVGLFASGRETLMFYRGGFFGYFISSFFIRYLGRFGGFILFATLLLLSLALVTEVLISTFLFNFLNSIRSLFRSATVFSRKQKVTPVKPLLNAKTQAFRTESRPKIVTPDVVSKSEAFKMSVPAKPKVILQETVAQDDKESKRKTPVIKVGDYHLPSVDLLESPPPLGARQIKEDLTNNAKILEETLEDFGIAVKVTDIERGPIITRYELEPAPGVKLNRIVALSDDISLAMKAQSVRIVAPIPGKGRVGVEVPNIQSNFVYLKEVMSASEFQDSDSKLTLVLGKDIAGKTVVADLGQMPHLLIAGTTGSGKTVCVNSLILSLLFKSSPSELRFVMIDPKMVELAAFNGLPHLLCPVVTDAKKASSALGWVVDEMESRYQLLAKAGLRNIEAYNQKQEVLPYIVIIIDELADLMMIAREQIENAITRLAQLSRAVGIHLILATQRPSVDVITGVIKANFPARISFKVASKVDSRTVLDMNGADKLLGKGDMLFLKPQESKVIRAQAALVTDKEIEAVTDFIKSQAEPIYDEEILKEKGKSSLVNGEKDELYEEAVRIIMESGQASVSILQRRMRLGYTRAARIIDMMEQEGLVGSYEGSKPRKILIDREAWLKEEMMQGKDKEG
ncbi:MAG: DNA translocase FtsK [Candidatus Omnitrophota bacterium]|nr:MAG: DNA translocase FtsK [Candidatus Omnitrophota bacterium]